MLNECSKVFWFSVRSEDGTCGRVGIMGRGDYTSEKAAKDLQDSLTVSNSKMIILHFLEEEYLDN